MDRRIVVSVAYVFLLTSCSQSTSTMPAAVPQVQRPIDAQPRGASGHNAACTLSRHFSTAFSDWYALGATSTSDAWAVGNVVSSYALQVTHYVNGNVSTLPSPNMTVKANPSIVPLNDNDVWLGGTTFSGAELLHWNGTSWRSIDNAPQLDAANTTIDAMTAGGSKDVWVAGTITGGRVPRLMLEHWNGHAMRLAFIGPYSVDGGVADVLALSRWNIWMLVDGLIDAAPGVEAVNWTGSQLHYHILPKLPSQSSMANLGQQLTATSPTNIWAIANAAVVGSWRSTGEIWRYDGSWQPYVYETSAPDPVFQGIAALSSSDAVITAFDATRPPLTPLTFTYDNTTRWHPESNTFAQAPIGKVALIHGTSSFWTFTTDGTGGVSEAQLATCN